MQIERLGQVIEGAALHGPHGGTEVSEGCDNDHRSILRQFAQLGQGGKSVHSRQAHVQDDSIGPLLLGLNKRFLGRGGDADVVPLLAESPFQGPANGFLIVDDQDVFHIRCHVDTPKNQRGRLPYEALRHRPR